VIWHGHACFELQGKSITIITDPFKGIGIPEPKANADIVLCSHSHGDHNNAKPVLGKDGKILEGFIGSTNSKGVSIKGVAAFHDETMGSKRGKNSIYTFSLDGVQFCHLGDLGHELSPQTIQEIGQVDVIIIPVGGHFTIGPETATVVSEKMKSKIIIPMHYRMPGLHSMFDLLFTVEDFLKEKKNIERINGSFINIEEDKLSKETRILVPSLSNTKR